MPSTKVRPGSGNRSMSLSWIFWNPRMLDPSNPMPSLNRSSVISPTGMLKCCQLPTRSVNRRSTIWMPRSRALRMTSAGLVLVGVVVDMAGFTSSRTLTASNSSIAIGLLPGRWATPPPPPRDPSVAAALSEEKPRVAAGRDLWTWRPTMAHSCLVRGAQTGSVRAEPQLAPGGLTVSTWDRASAWSLK